MAVSPQAGLERRSAAWPTKPVGVGSQTDRSLYRRVDLGVGDAVDEAHLERWIADKGVRGWLDRTSTRRRARSTAPTKSVTRTPSDPMSAPLIFADGAANDSLAAFMNPARGSPVFGVEIGSVVPCVELDEHAAATSIRRAAEIPAR